MNKVQPHIPTLLDKLCANFHSWLTQEVVEEAQRLNPWFSACDITHAALAIEKQYLNHEKLVSWLTLHPTLPVAEPKVVGIVAAGNIPLAGFFDVLCVVAAGHRCVVRTSSKDKPLMEAVIRGLRECGAWVEFMDGSVALDALIASGSDTTMETIGKTYADIPTLLRGHRNSVAIISGNESDAQLASLGEDMFRYNSMGCRNVTLLWVPESYDIAHLVRGVQGAGSIVSHKYVNAYRQLRATAILTGEPLIEGGFFMLAESPKGEFPTRPAEVHVARYSHVEQVERWLHNNDTIIQCVVGGELVKHPRAAAFGRAQWPSLWEWPDGVDVLDFLAHV